ncbi:Uncharacterised protein [Legionella beliardensis]|uniref:Uncharacterized protein n=1 Tax=Legionella beliardensis TaxID=91822 RepID=A0A378HYV6_9GAMM|nr:hypothetical protein [Legionella beliardensis]STX27942.1 Uncharacterised protein [Legionella beliardensis]
MPSIILKNYVTYDSQTREFYASELWLKLIALLDEQQSKVFMETYKNKIPLQVMVDYTQKNFLRKENQRWAFENYNDFSAKKKQDLTILLNDYNQIEAQSFPKQADLVLLLGTSTVNICKRLFYLFDAITKEGVNVGEVLISGNTEPYDKFMDTLKAVMQLHPEYFREGLSEKDIPSSITMHETMCFVIENLRWPENKKPLLIKQALAHPSNTNHEAEAAVNYFPTFVSKMKNKTANLLFKLPSIPSVVTLSHQPFLDRQGITVTGAFKKNLSEEVPIEIAGPGLQTYPSLNDLPASTMSSAQIVDNLTRTLYEIKQNLSHLFKEQVKEKEEQAIEQPSVSLM